MKKWGYTRDQIQLRKKIFTAIGDGQKREETNLTFKSQVEIELKVKKKNNHFQLANTFGKEIFEGKKYDTLGY